jgi:hypothetical protein
MVLRTSGGILRVAFMGPVMLPLASAILRTALRLPPVARRAAGTLTGIAIHYPQPPGSPGIAGRRAPDVALAGGGRLYEALRDGTFVVISASGISNNDHLRAVAPAQSEHPTTLVRPDGYVAWAASNPSASEVRQALADWSVT